LVLPREILNVFLAFLSTFQSSVILPSTRF
jgi:hypothetical protein